MVIRNPKGNNIPYPKKPIKKHATDKKKHTFFNEGPWGVISLSETIQYTTSDIYEPASMMANDCFSLNKTRT
jgi:hypothetical protein